MGALRLTIEHRSGPAVGGETKSQAAAALWVRVGSGLGGPDELAHWRADFEQARCNAAQTEERHLRFEVAGRAGPVAVEVARLMARAEWSRWIRRRIAACWPWTAANWAGPFWNASILPIPTAARKPFEPIPLAASGGTYWEAESGVIFPGLIVAEDAMPRPGITSISRPTRNFPAT